MPVCIVIFQPVHNADFIVPVEIDGTIHQVSYNFCKGTPAISFQTVT